MGELAEERNYRSRSTWTLPVTDAHAFGWMTLRAANDYVRGFAELFDSPRPPLYAHMAIARSALESAVVSQWLSEPGIGSLERIKRALCELLYSAREVNDLGLDVDSDAHLAEWTTVAHSFGWRVDHSRAKPIIVDHGRSSETISCRTKRPRVSDGIRRLAGSGDESRIGDLLFSRLPVVTHVTWFGLQSGMDLSGAKHDERSGVARVAIGADTGKVSAIAFYAPRATERRDRSRHAYRVERRSVAGRHPAGDGPGKCGPPSRAERRHSPGRIDLREVSSTRPGGRGDARAAVRRQPAPGARAHGPRDRPRAAGGHGGRRSRSSPVRRAP